MCAGLYAHAREEEQQAHFAQHEVGGGGGVGVDFVAVAECADEDSHDERTAGEAELHAHAQGDLSHEDTQHDAEEDGAHVGVVEAFHAAADGALHGFHVFFRTRHENAVAHLQAQVAVGEEVHAVTRHAGYVHAVNRAEMDLAEGLAVDFGLGDDEAVRNVLLFLVDIVLPRLALDVFADEHGDRLCFVLCANEVDFHTDFKLRLAVGDRHHAVLDAAHHDELAVEEVVQVLQRASCHGGVRYAEHEVLRRGVRIAFLLLADLLLLLFQFDVAEIAHEDSGKNDAHNAEGISAGIARSEVGHCAACAPVEAGLAREVGHNRVGCAETGRVGNCAVHGAHHHREVVVRRVEHEEVQTQHHCHVEQHDAHGDEVHAHAALLERGEKARAYLQTDAINKENQAQFFYEVDRGFLLGVVDAAEVVEQMSRHDTHKQDERYAEGNAAELDFPQFHAQADYDGIKHNKVGDGTGARQDINEPFHKYKKLIDIAFSNGPIAVHAAKLEIF